MCENSWDTPDAMVVCRQLGYAQESAVPLSSANVVDGTGRIWFNNALCTGTESRLISCHRIGGLGNNNCNHAQDVGVRCTLGMCVYVCYMNLHMKLLNINNGDLI